jgi:hypothetical protein
MYNQNMPTPPRRWFAIRLRTMFVLAAVLSVPLTWVGYSLNWIRERHRVLNDVRSTAENGPDPQAPGLLWLFGERGRQDLWLRQKSPVDLRYAATLFPEGRIGRLIENEQADGTTSMGCGPLISVRHAQPVDPGYVLKMSP